MSRLAVGRELSIGVGRWVLKLNWLERKEKGKKTRNRKSSPRQVVRKLKFRVDVDCKVEIKVSDWLYQCLTHAVKAPYLSEK